VSVYTGARRRWGQDFFHRHVTEWDGQWRFIFLLKEVVGIFYAFLFKIAMHPFGSGGEKV
jgi:hypothetical protein